MSKTQRMMVSGGFSLVMLLLLQLVLPTTWLSYAIVGSVAVIVAALLWFWDNVGKMIQNLLSVAVLITVLAAWGGKMFLVSVLVGKSADVLGGFAAESFWERLLPATMVATSLVLAIFAFAAMIMAVAKVFSLIREKRACHFS